jgi:hypothetical protein
LSNKDSGYNYPLGLVNFCFTTLTKDNQVSLIFVTNMTRSQVVARDYNSSTGKYQTIPGAVITETTYNGQAALQLTYNITQGSSLDSSSTAGTIDDPVGLAVSNIGAPNTGFGVYQTNPFKTILIFASLSSTILLFEWIIRRYNKVR